MVTGSTHDLSSDTSLDDVTNHLTEVDGEPSTKSEEVKVLSESTVEEMEHESPSSSVTVPDQTAIEPNVEGCSSSKNGAESEATQTNSNNPVEQVDTKDQAAPPTTGTEMEKSGEDNEQKQAPILDSKKGVEEKEGETRDEDGAPDAKMPKLGGDSPTTIAAATIAVNSTVVSSS